MTNITDVMPEHLRPYAKAIVTFAAALLGAILMVVDPEQIPDWLQVLAVLFGVTGATYGPRNDDVDPS